MTRTGVDTRGPDGEEPEELAAWLDAGFDGEDAAVWRRWRFTIGEARAWVGAGVPEGLEAAQWSAAGVDPPGVAAWQDAGIGASEAVRWHEMGFGVNQARAEKGQGRGPEEAFAVSHPGRGPGSGTPLRAARATSFGGGWGAASPGGLPPGQAMWGGIDPRIRHSYQQRQWIDEEAVGWATQGIDAADAYLWHDLGLRPAEAGRLARRGRTPGDIVREWWPTGIPFDEVAEWIGAGLDAAEAVEQRSKGVTVEQAAALRSLRLEEPSPTGRVPAPPELLQRQGPPGSEVPGPPPEDEPTARAAVERAFTAMLEVDEDGSMPAVDGGSNLGAFLQEASQRHRMSEDPSTRSVQVDEVRFVNDHEARVVYTMLVVGPFSGNPMLRGRSGRAVLVDGQWKVARDTLCSILQMAGVEYPPRE